MLGRRNLGRWWRPRFIIAAEQHGTVHLALAMAHNVHAPHQPLGASDCDVIDVRTSYE
jgi:hypothetical protein